MKNERMRYLALCMMHCALCIILSGCVEEYEADISAEDTNLLVVEGYICSASQNRFSLSRTQSFKSSDMPQKVTGAMVSVRGTDGSEYMTQATDGNYTCWIERLAPDVEYYLHIETDGEVYESTPQKPLPTEKIADVRGVQDTPESSIDVLVSTEPPLVSGQVNYYTWTYDETWQVYPDYKTAIYFDTEKMDMAYKDHQFPECGWVDATSSTIMVAASTSYAGQHIQGLKLYDIGRDNVRMFHRYSGLIHQRAISKAEYEYELARRQAGSEMGGLFTPLPSALPTNIHCLTSNKRVIGFIGCALNTSAYRFFLKGSEYAIRKPIQTDSRLWLDGPTMDECLAQVMKGLYLCEWEPPEMSADQLLHTAWAVKYQLDVRERYKGAYIEEPDFWSLEENVSY